MKAILTRYYADDECTMGFLTFEGMKDPVFWTIERPWLDNKPNVSCIPTGTYEVAHYSSSRFPNAYQIIGVPERTAILIHSANFADDLQGCIAPGVSAGYMNRNGKQVKCVTSSTQALHQMKQLAWQKEGFTLTII